MIAPNTCGCARCGGARVRNDTLTARRVLAYAPYIVARRNAAPGSLANRHIHPSLYSRALLAVSRRITP